jgi:hypothetical protein
VSPVASPSTASTTWRTPVLVARANSTNSRRRRSVERSTISRDATEANSSVKPLRWSASLRTSNSSMDPQRWDTSPLRATRLGASGRALRTGTLIHGSPARETIRTPPLRPVAKAVSRPLKAPTTRRCSASMNAFGSRGWRMAS